MFREPSPSYVLFMTGLLFLGGIFLTLVGAIPLIARDIPQPFSVGENVLAFVLGLITIGLSILMYLAIRNKRL